jgi:transposase
MAAVPFENRNWIRPNGARMEGFDHRGIDVFVGVGMAKQDHYAHAVGRNAAELFDRSVGNDEAAINRLIDDASGHGRVALVIDMPSSAAQLLLAVAREREVPVAYVTGLQMRRAAELYAGSAKTDPRDAWVLADFARRHADQLVWLDIGDDLLAKLRILNGRDVDLAEDANRATNRCRDALTSISPALERAVGSRLGHAGVRDLLAAYPTPTALRTAGASAIRAVIAARSPRLADKVTDAVTGALRAQTVTLPGEQTWGEIVVGLVADLERIHTQRDALGKQIEAVFLEHPLGQVLVTLCGFGPRTGARTLAEIGDPTRFANGGRLAAYAGLAPIDRRSGRSINSATASRRGNHRLKNAMFLAAFVAIRHDPHARAYYQRKRAEGKKHNAAVICVARRRCDLIWAMLTRNEPYDATRSENHPKAA